MGDEKQDGREAQASGHSRGDPGPEEQPSLPPGSRVRAAQVRVSRSRPADRCPAQPTPRGSELPAAPDQASPCTLQKWRRKDFIFLFNRKSENLSGSGEGSFQERRFHSKNTHESSEGFVSEVKRKCCPFFVPWAGPKDAKWFREPQRHRLLSGPFLNGLDGAQRK